MKSFSDTDTCSIIFSTDMYMMKGIEQELIEIYRSGMDKAALATTLHK